MKYVLSWERKIWMELEGLGYEDYNQMKIALILVVILVIISAETIGGKEHAKAKEVAHHDNTKKTEEKANKQQGHDKDEAKKNVENDHEKKNTHAKSANHQNSKGKKKAHHGKVEESHTAKPKGSTKTTAHTKNAKNHSPAKKAEKKNVHTHQAKGKEAHINKKIAGSHKTKNIPHKVNPKRQIEKIIPDDKTKQHLVSTNNSTEYIQANLTTKVVKDQQKPYYQSISNVSNETALKEESVSALNSSEVVAKVKEKTNTSIAAPLLSSPAKQAGNRTVNKEQKSSTESEDDSDEEQSSDSETQKQAVVEGNTTKNEQSYNQTVKQDNPVQLANKTQAKQSAPKEDNSTLIVKESNTSKILPEAETNQTKAQQAPIIQEKAQENQTTVQEAPIEQENNKTAIIKADLPKPQVKQSLPKQQEAHTSVTIKKNTLASHQKAQSNFHTKVEKKTDTVTIDASAYKESQNTQKIIPPAQPQKHQTVEAKKETAKQPVQTKAPQPERHLKVQQTAQDDIDKLLKQVNAQKAKQKSKIADQILDLQVKLHQKPTKEDTSLTLYIIFFFLAILILVPIIKCLTKTNHHPNPGQRMIQFQEEDSSRLSGPESGENLEEMI